MLNVQSTPYKSIKTVTLDIPDSATLLDSLIETALSQDWPRKQLQVQALSTNTDSIFLRSAETDEDGIELLPGASIVLPAVRGWWVIAAVDNEDLMVTLSGNSVLLNPAINDHTLEIEFDTSVIGPSDAIVAQFQFDDFDNGQGFSFHGNKPTGATSANEINTILDGGTPENWGQGEASWRVPVTDEIWPHSTPMNTADFDVKITQLSGDLEPFTPDQLGEWVPLDSGFNLSWGYNTVGSHPGDTVVVRVDIRRKGSSQILRTSTQTIIFTPV